jgi:hypothetical protein
VIQLKVPPPFGTLAAWTSSVSNLPVRAVFAWQHDVPLAAYDKLVGAHVLGETYPGLNSYSDQTTATIPVGALGRSGTRRVFVGLNRRGAVDITLPADITATWNGERFTGHTDDLNRGVNELVLHGPPGTEVQPLPIRASP